MKKYNKHFNYIVVFGGEKYSPEDFYNSRKKYAYLHEAKKAAASYSNAYIVKCKLDVHSGDLLYCTII